jgi:valyl-tRNA synthetase
MMMLGIEMMGDVPFRQVHIHGLVRDAERQKMSKTKGNTIDPLVINEKYGTDAVRFALLISAAPGGDIALSEDRIASCRNFANKIWNASRLLFSKSKEGAGVSASLADRWVRSRLDGCSEVANRAFREHRYHEAAQVIWHFFWDDFCDWYLELKKQDSDWSYAYIAYEKALRLLHPLMPFLTEELWHRMGNSPKDSIALQSYPIDDLFDIAVEHEMELLQEIVTAARALRADHKVDRKPLLRGTLYCTKPLHLDSIERLANVKLTVETGAAPKLEGAVRSTPDFDLVLEMPKAANQSERLLKENIELEKVIANSDRQLSNDEIISKMPEKVVETLRAKNVAYKAQLQKNLDALANE